MSGAFLLELVLVVAAGQFLALALERLGAALFRRAHRAHGARKERRRAAKHREHAGRVVDEHWPKASAARRELEVQNLVRRGLK